MAFRFSGSIVVPCPMKSSNAETKLTPNWTNLSLRKSLQLILEPMGMDYVVEREVLKVTTASKLETMIASRVYPVGDLCETTDEAIQLLESIECGFGIASRDRGRPTFGRFCPGQNTPGSRLARRPRESPEYPAGDAGRAAVTGACKCKAVMSNSSHWKGLLMIVDKIENYVKYANLPAALYRAIEYIGSTDFSHVENGQYELDGKKMVSIVNRYQTKTLNNAIWESHRKYIDVQFVAGGHERFGLAPMSSAPPVTTEYNAEKDVIFYGPGTDTFDAPAGTFMIFYPDDIHAPGLAAGSPPKPSDDVKVVVKVAVDLG